MPLDIPSFKYVDTKDTEDACTLVAGADVLLISDEEIPVVGQLDDILLPITTPVAEACALEQVSEYLITDVFDLACDKPNWKWEIHRRKWWSPIPTVFLVFPTC